MATPTKTPLDKELERLKRAKFPGSVRLQREGVEVVAEPYLPGPFYPKYYATWIDPVTDRRVVGQASKEEVHAALERRVRST